MLEKGYQNVSIILLKVNVNSILHNLSKMDLPTFVFSLSPYNIVVEHEQDIDGTYKKKLCSLDG